MRTFLTFVFIGLIVLSNAVRIAVIGKPRPPITGQVALYGFLGDIVAVVGLLYIGGVI